MEYSGQNLIPLYAHETILLIYIHLHEKYLFMNKKMINITNISMKYIIKFYLGKRTNYLKRKQVGKNIQELLTSINNFSKIIDLRNLDLEQLQKNVDQIIKDLDSNNQKGKIYSSGV